MRILVKNINIPGLFNSAELHLSMVQKHTSLPFLSLHSPLLVSFGKDIQPLTVPSVLPSSKNNHKYLVVLERAYIKLQNSELLFVPDFIL